MKGRKRGLITVQEIKDRYSKSKMTKRDLSLESGLPLKRICEILKDVRRDKK